MKLQISWLFLALQAPHHLQAFMVGTSTVQSSRCLWATGADIESISNEAESLSGGSVVNKGAKVNEIDFCMAPADVSISRSNDSLTRALNNASNRAVRRILLAKSWPSAQALNLSLRQALGASGEAAEAESSKCPVPRPILNILMRRKDDMEPKQLRSDEEYVQDQLVTFRQSYSSVPGYDIAEAYLECILSLATSNEESPRVKEVLEAGIYDDSYRRVLSVLKSAGVVLEILPDGRQKIADKLIDQDICLSMMDKIQTKLQKPIEETIEEAPRADEDDGGDDNDGAESPNEGKIRLRFWRQSEQKAGGADKTGGSDEVELTSKDLGGVLLSAEEPTMTRQLNVLSNIVQRALLFGGDQELRVLSETLAADKPAFLQRWYPSPDSVDVLPPEDETRPGVQYLNCLVNILETSYENGVTTDLDPPFPLIQSYANAYERLTASLVEMGSGYLKAMTANKNVPLPRTAQEELGRFALWESAFRAKESSASSYPEDLEGIWEVEDQVGGQTIGMSTVVFGAQGEVSVSAPLEGLRWRLDPGPTHLDTCTFQVLGEDGTVLQYRGFIDRGARLEARVSKRPLRIRGSVMFQMRDGEVMGEDYWKDILPINYKTGTTKFVMTKIGGDGSSKQEQSPANSK